jgi:Tfp pilus assembly protein PilF
MIRLLSNSSKALWSALVVSLASAAGPEIPAGGRSWRPIADDEVVCVLRPARLSAAERELRQMRQSLSADPTNLTLATALARLYIQRSRDEADPRFLGAAAGALDPWWRLSAPDPGVLVLRATVRQSLHEFESAATDLRLALDHDPRLAQAWLTLATIQCIRGDFSAARHSAVNLAGLTDPLTTTTIAAHIAALTGRARPARIALEKALATNGVNLRNNTPAHRSVELWARTILAEISTRLGDTTAAERQFESALSLGPNDPYLLASHADFLLDQGRESEVARRLMGRDRIDPLLLRLAEATKDPTHIRSLAERLDAAIARGDRAHLREAARFELRLRRNSKAALLLALENWEIQREPADARILWESAEASGNLDALKQVESWISTTGLEDIALSKRVSPSLTKGPIPLDP